MIEFFFAVSGKITAAIAGLTGTGHVSPAVVALIALGGLIAGISPGGLAGALAALGQLHPADRRAGQDRGVIIASAFSLGMVTALAILGFLTAWAGRAVLASGLSRWLPLLTLAIGLNLLGIVRWHWFRLRATDGPPASGAAHAFWLGIPFGLAASPCTLPILITVLTVAVASGSALFGLVGLSAFALGHSLPVLLLGLCSDQMGTLPQFDRATPHLRRAAGVLITVASVYFLTLGRGLLG